MAIHNLNFDQGDDKQSLVAPSGVLPESPSAPTPILQPADNPTPIATPASDDVRDSLHYTVDNYEDKINLNFHEEIRELAVPGFHLMDTGLKNYFTGIRIPVARGTEQYRIMHVKVAGADASALMYSDKSIVGGRPQLPYLSITRTAENADPKRFSPAYLPVAHRYANNGKRLEQVFRPTPYLIDYTLEIWGEHKRDVEHALYAIKSRFNPVASFYLDEQGVTYEVVMHSTGSSDASDLEADAETHAEIRKSITIQLEGWLPLPTKVVPTILAKPVSIREGFYDSNGQLRIPGETYTVIRDNL